ncbi:MAG: dienelactone hydrolase family protein, partial [Planctomycetaceae bacterium]|nr:dienelactone hydrolase family protein [Planctomycetaceae bacterium]
SPRNSGWFLCALSARRALTFLEQQPEVDPRRLGVYGHSMGGKLTVLTSVDERVKAAAPSCGGISDRYNSSPLFNATLGDDVSLREISCPIFFLSPSNDFHGRIGDLPDAVHEIQSKDWRVTCSPHHNHQDTPEYEVATQLWFDQHLKGTFSVPQAPRAKLQLETNDGVPQLVVKPDTSREILSIDVFYTQHGKPNEQPEDREDTMHRFWHCVSPKKINGEWTAALPLTSTDKPLWVYANVLYKLDEPITGAGYYYGIYTADSFNLSSVMNVASPDELQAANVSAAQMPSRLIENFEGEWQKEWFSYGRSEWSLMTHKLRDATWAAPEGARLAFDVKSESPNKLVVLLDDYAAVIELSGGSDWQHVELTLNDIRNYAEESLPNWNS